MTTDLFGTPEPVDQKAEAMAMRQKIMGELEECPDFASVSALEKHYAPTMIAWRDGSDAFKRELVNLIRNGFRYRRHILRYFNDGHAVR